MADDNAVTTTPTSTDPSSPKATASQKARPSTSIIRSTGRRRPPHIGSASRKISSRASRHRGAALRGDGEDRRRREAGRQDRGLQPDDDGAETRSVRARLTRIPRLTRNFVSK